MSAVQQHQQPGVNQQQWKRVRADLRRALNIPKMYASRDGNARSNSISRECKQGVESIVVVSEITCQTPPLLPTPAVQRALVVAQKGVYELRDTHAVPELHNDTEVLIRNRAVGLNPIDWKSVAYNFCLPSFPWVCSCPASLVGNRSLTKMCRSLGAKWPASSRKSAHKSPMSSREIGSGRVHTTVMPEPGVSRSTLLFLTIPFSPYLQVFHLRKLLAWASRLSLPPWHCGSGWLSRCPEWEGEREPHNQGAPINGARPSAPDIRALTALLQLRTRPRSRSRSRMQGKNGF